MARFEHDMEAMFDSEKLALQSVREVHKDIDGVTQGKPLTTSRSEGKIGRPQEMTVFSVAEILQGIPSFSSPAEALGRYQSLVDSSFLLARADTPLASHLKSGLVPKDVKAALEAMELAQRYEKGEAPPAADGTTPAAGAPGGPVAFTAGTVTFDLLKAHPNIPYICDNFAGPASRNEIDPRIMWVVKFLADNGCVIWITSGRRAAGGLTASGNVSLHGSGRAVDIRNKAGGGSLIGDPWVPKVNQLLDSLTGGYRPYEVGFSPKFTGGPGIKWITDKNNHVHIAYKGDPSAAATGGVTQPTSGAATQLAMTPISSVTGTPIAVGAITTSLPNQHPIIAPNASQLAIINTIVAVGRAVAGADPTLTPTGTLQLLVAGLETGWVESTMANLPGGDRDSIGVFQQRPSQGWGQAAHCLSKVNYSLNDVAACAKEFFLRAAGSRYKNGKGTAGQLAQSVQISGVPDAYDKRRNQAVSDLARLGINASSIDK